MTGFINDGAYLNYVLILNFPYHFLEIDEQQYSIYSGELYSDELSIYKPYEGVWMFTYIGIDKNNN